MQMRLETDELTLLEGVEPLSPWGGAAHDDPLGVVGKIVGFISHDLRLPLTAIIAYTELMATREMTMSQRMELYQEVQSAVDRMTDMISSLIELSRGRHTLKPQKANIAERVMQSIRTIAMKKSDCCSAVISYDHQGVTEGWFDAQRLDRIITNLVANACDAVSSGGRVEISSFGLADRMEFFVWDNGPGIPEPVRDSLFTPFVSYGKDDGTGLGLAIARRLTEDHGGELHLDETCEEGTRFRFTLPYLPPSNNPHDEPTQA
jgi:signal transduction histidine kinase